MTLKSLSDALSVLGDGSVKKAFPMGLPDFDPVRQILEGKEDLTGTESSKHVLDPLTCSVWAFNKQWIREHTVSQYTGSNEKAIVIVKLTKKGAGAPSREPVVDEQTQKAIMALHRKKEDERKVLCRSTTHGLN